MTTCESPSESEIQPFLASIATFMGHDRQEHAQTSPDFTVFDFIRSDENCLSDIYSTLLDPRGSHGQGTLFLEILLSQLGRPIPVEMLSQAGVRREGLTYLIKRRNRRMDIIIECSAPGGGGLCIAIENKIQAEEQGNQAYDYLSHLAEYQIMYGRDTLLIYLTPNGRAPNSVMETDLPVPSHLLACWSYADHLIPWLREGRTKCRSSRLQDFLGSLIDHLSSLVDPPETHANAGTALTQMSFSSNTQMFLLGDIRRLELAAHVTDAWIGLKSRIWAEFLVRLEIRLARQLSIVDRRTDDGPFVGGGRYPTFKIWLTGWPTTRALALQSAEGGKVVRFGIVRETNCRTQLPMKPEILNSIREGFPNASDKGVGSWWEAFIPMTSPASDWSRPDVMFRMHGEASFLEEVATQLRHVAVSTERTFLQSRESGNSF
jgi:hypothetical protein